MLSLLLNPQQARYYTLNPNLLSLNPPTISLILIPSTLYFNPNPSTLNPILKPLTLEPQCTQPSTSNPNPSTLNSDPLTLNPIPKP